MASLFPEVEIFVNSNGVTVFCRNLNTPRFVPFDLKGRCSVCKSDNVEIDYVLQSDGMTIYCSRFKQERFIKFDSLASYNDRSKISIRARGKVYNVPLNPNLVAQGAVAVDSLVSSSVDSTVGQHEHTHQQEDKDKENISIKNIPNE